MLKAFDLFCGVGGLTYGLKQSGITVNGGLDIDDSCRYAYEHNCGATFNAGDIRNVSYADISKYVQGAECRALVGCAPCQPFSALTARSKPAPSDETWRLIDEFLRIVLEGKPQIIFMENVPQLRNKEIYQKFKQSLVSAGYNVSDGTLACSGFGVPQSRRRLVLLGSLLGTIKLPEPEVQHPPTVQQVIGGLEPIEHGQTNKQDPLHRCSRLSAINLQRIQASKPGGSWCSDWPASLLPDCYKRQGGKKFVAVYGRMRWQHVAPTLTTQFYHYGSGRYGHPEQDRALSLREGALLQTFPEKYKFSPPDKKIIFKQVGRHIGNSVPPSFARSMGKIIMKHLKSVHGYE